MENFRILLDLSDLEDREHKYVWMLISTIEFKYVADFKKAVINKLALNRNDIKLFVNGGLLLEEEKIMILRENDTVQIQYEKLSDSVCHSSSYMETLDNKLSLNIGEYNGNEVVRHSKKHKRKSKEVFLEVANENMEKGCNKLKRKRDVNTVDKIERREDEMLIQDENPMNGNDINVEGICNRNKKKHKKSFSTPSAKDVLIQNEIKESTTMPVAFEANTSTTVDEYYQESEKMEKGNNIEEINTMPVAFDANISTVDKSYQESEKMKKRNNIEEINTMPVAFDANTSTVDKSYQKMESKPTDIVVESFIQGSNCKKRKRKRHRKRKPEPNLLGSFMSSNINSLQKLAKETPPTFNPCDNFAGIRKHIRFTSPTPDSSNMKFETVDLETNSSDSQAEMSPYKTCISPAAKPSPSPSRNMYIDNANKIANMFYPKISSSSSNTCTLPNTEISSLTTSKTSENHVNKPSPKLSSQTCIKPSTSTKLVSTNSTFENFATMKPEIYMPNKQKSLPQSFMTASPVLKKNENTTSAEVLKSKECEPLKSVITSYADYSPLLLLPPVGSHVAFKLLELDENYSPQISNYKEGVIKLIKPKSEEIVIQLNKVEIKPGRTGKFENLNEDEVPSNEVVKTVTTSWSSLIDPRLISRGIEEQYVYE